MGVFDDLIPAKAPAKTTGAFDDLIPQGVPAPKPATTGAFDDLIPQPEVPMLDRSEMGYVTRGQVTPAPSLAPVHPLPIAQPPSRFTLSANQQVEPAPETDPAEEAARAQTNFSRNKQYIQPGATQFQTQLSAADENRFRQWLRANNVPFDPEQTAPQDYDMRGYWQAAQNPADWHDLQRNGVIPPEMAPGGTKIDPNDGKPHFPDYWKTPYHQTFSSESQFATPDAPSWNGQDQLVDRAGNVLFDDRQPGGKPQRPLPKGGQSRASAPSPFLAEVESNLRKGNIPPEYAQQAIDAYNQAHMEGSKIDPRSVAGRAALDALNEITNGGDLQATVERYVIGGGATVDRLNQVKDQLAAIQNILDQRAGVATVETARQMQRPSTKGAYIDQHNLESSTSSELLALSRDLKQQLPAIQAAAAEKRGNMLLNLARVAGKWEGMPDPQGIAANLAAGVGHVAGQGPSPENIVGVGAAPARAALRVAGESIAQMAKRLGISLSEAMARDAAVNAGVAAATDPAQQAANINEGRQAAYDPLQSISNIGGAAVFGAAFGAAGRAAGWTADAWKAWRAKTAEDLMNEFLRRNAGEGAARQDQAARSNTYPPPPGAGAGPGGAGPRPGAGPAGGAGTKPKADYTAREWAGKFGSTATKQADGNFKTDENGFVMSDAGGPIMFKAPRMGSKAEQTQANKKAHRAAGAWILEHGNTSADQGFGIENHPAADGKSETLTIQEKIRKPKEEPKAEEAAPGTSSEEAKMNTGQEAPKTAAGEPPVYGPLGGAKPEEAQAGAKSAESGPEDLSMEEILRRMKEKVAGMGAGTKENPAKPETSEDMAAAGANAAESDLNNREKPTEAQKTAGNYKKAHIQLAPKGEAGPKFDISVENPKGSTRSGTSPDGTTWANEQAAHYGYLKRTEGSDNDHLDVFVGDNPKSEKVWVIDQVDPKTGAYDETKSMMGFDSAMQAIEAYSKSYGADGETRIGAVTPMSIDAFDAWRKSPASKGQASTVEFAKPEEAPQSAGNYNQNYAEKPGAESTTVEGVSSVPASQVGVDAKKFQFKSGGDEQGVGEALRGVKKWESEKADIVTLFKDNAGKLWVADGHQRVGLAQRLEAGGHPPINLLARTYDAKDGYTPADVMIIAAAKNIAQGSGTPLDAAKIIRRLGLSDEIVKNLPPKSALVRDGQDLAKLGDEAFQQAANEVVPWNVAAVVGREIAGDKQQLAAIEILRKADVASVQEAQAIIDQIKAQGFEETINQGGLFGDEQVAKSLVLERAKVLSAALTELKRNRTLFRQLLKGADIAQAAGNKLDTAANQEEKANYEALIAQLSKLANVKGEISDALTKAARDHQAGKRAAAAAQEFIAVVSRLPDGWARGHGPGEGASFAEAPRAFFTPERVKALDQSVRALIQKYAGAKPEGGRGAAGGLHQAPAGTGNVGDHEPGGRGGGEAANLAASKSSRSGKGGDVGPLLPGFEPSTKEQLAAKGVEKKPEQKPMDFGLFGEGHKQMDIEPGKGAEIIPPAPKKPAWSAAKRTLAGDPGKPVDGLEDFEELRAQHPDTLEGAAEAARQWVLDRGKAHNVENYVILGRDGEVHLAGTSNQEGSGAILKADFERILREDWGATFHHNHPNNSSLSQPDIRMLTMGALRRCVAYGHDGNIFIAERGPKLMALLHEPVAGLQFQALYDRFYDGIGKEILRRAGAGEIQLPGGQEGESLANLMHGHAINLALEKLGIITYVSSGDQVARVHAESQQIADAAVGSYLDDQASSKPFARVLDRSVVDRSARPVRQQEAMGRVSREPEAPAGAGRPGAVSDEAGKPAPQHGGDAGREAGAPETIAEQPAAITEASRPYFTGGPGVPPAAARATVAGAMNFLQHINRPGFGARLERYQHTFQRMVADELIRGVQVQEFIEKQTGVPTPDQENFYLRAQAAVGIKAEELERADRRFIQPIFNLVRGSAHDAHWFEKGLYAKHAPERNRRIAAINTAMPDGGSGVDTATANAYLAGLSPADRAELDRMSVLVDRLRREDLSNRVNAGLMDAAHAMNLIREMPNYVPLQGREDLEGDEDFVRAGQGFSVKGQEFKQALGRWSDPTHILAHMISQYQTGIMRAENNKVGQTLANLVAAHPDPDFWNVDKVKITRGVSSSTGLVTTNYSQDAAPEHTVMFKLNGHPHRIWIADDKFVAAIKNQRSQDILRALRWVGAPLHLWRMLTIPWNPEFLVGNMSRDIQDGLIQGTAMGGKQIAWRTVKNYLPSVQAAFLGAHGMDNTWTTWMRRAAAAGALSGNFQPIDVNHWTKNVDWETATGVKGMGRKGARALMIPFHEIERFNTAIEAGMRVAVFRAAKEAGYSDLHAGNIAKNATVNFDRKGTLGPYWSPLYAFFQAAINGNYGLLRIIKRSPKFMAAVGGALFMMGAGEALMWEWLRKNGTDDQKAQADAYFMAPQWVTERNAMVPFAKPKDAPWLQQPLGWALAMPYGFGRQAMIRALGTTSNGEMFTRMFHQALTWALPVDPTNGASGLAPTMLRPAIEVENNKAWTGRPIYPDKHGKAIPDSQNYYDSVGPIWKEIAANLNKWTGGDEVKPGMVDWSPNSMQYLWDQYISGAGAFVDRIKTDYDKVNRGEELDWSEIPVARRFLGHTTAAAFRDQFYTVWDQLSTVDDQRDGYQKAIAKAPAGAEKDAAQANLRAFKEQNAEALKFFDQNMKGAKDQIDNARQQIKQIDANTHLTDEQKKAKRRAQADKILGIARAAIERYNSQVLAPQQSQRALIKVTPTGVAINY